MSEHRFEGQHLWQILAIDAPILEKLTKMDFLSDVHSTNLFQVLPEMFLQLVPSHEPKIIHIEAINRNVILALNVKRNLWRIIANHPKFVPRQAAIPILDFCKYTNSVPLQSNQFFQTSSKQGQYFFRLDDYQPLSNKDQSSLQLLPLTHPFSHLFVER